MATWSLDIAIDVMKYFGLNLDAHCHDSQERLVLIAWSIYLYAYFDIHGQSSARITALTGTAGLAAWVSLKCGGKKNISSKRSLPAAQVMFHAGQHGLSQWHEQRSK